MLFIFNYLNSQTGLLNLICCFLNSAILLIVAFSYKFVEQTCGVRIPNASIEYLFIYLKLKGKKKLRKKISLIPNRCPCLVSIVS